MWKPERRLIIMHPPVVPSYHLYNCTLLLIFAICSVYKKSILTCGTATRCLTHATVYVTHQKLVEGQVVCYVAMWCCNSLLALSVGVFMAAWWLAGREVPAGYDRPPVTNAGEREPVMGVGGGSLAYH